MNIYEITYYNHFGLKKIKKVFARDIKAAVKYVLMEAASRGECIFILDCLENRT